MLFRKKLYKNCLYCYHATISENGEPLCAKQNGQVAKKTCYRFKYDPCKRTPPRAKAPNFRIFDEDDFSL